MLQPINDGISLSLNLCYLVLSTDWLDSIQRCEGFFFFFLFCDLKRSGWSDEHFGIGSLLSFSRMCMAYVQESCCVPPSLPGTHRSCLEV